MTRRAKALLCRLLAMAALALPAAALAASYTFPGNMPGACSGSNGSYTCSGFNLGYGDTVTISGTRPATITINGNFGTNTSQINSAGSAADLSLVVNGTLTLGYQARITANITAASVIDGGGGNVTLNGNVTATGGNISLAYVTTVSGNVSTSGTGTITTPQSGSIGGNVSAGSGSITISDSGNVAGSVTGSGNISVGFNAAVAGNVSTGSGAVSLGYLGTVNGNVTTNGAVTLSQASQVGGNIAGGAGNVSVAFLANVGGTTTTSTGTINFAQWASAQACVRSTGSASITLGFQSNVDSVCCGSSCSSSCVINNSFYAMPPLCAATTSLLADYRMDETAGWSGSSGEVRDSSGNGYNATAATASAGTPLATTASVSPAYGTTTAGSCGYGVFNRTPPANAAYTYVQLPGNFPALTGSFTLLAWIRSTNADLAGQRVVAHDDNQNGWALSLGDASSPRLRLFNRNVSPSGSVTITGSSGTGATTANCTHLCLDSAAVLADNTWYYVAASVDTATRRVNLQVYNTSGTLLSGASVAYSGTWAVGTGGTVVGGESISSSEGQSSAFHFNGNIDELQFYSGVLTSTAITTQLSRSRTCPLPAIGSFAITGTGSASTCSPQTLTITARDSTGATLTGYTGTINLSTSSGRGVWSAGTGPAPAGTLNLGAANSGLASYTFAAADNGVVKLQLAHSLAQNVTVTVVDSAVSASSSTSAPINYRDNAFVWTEDAADLVTGSFVAVAGRPHDLRVSLWKKDPATGNCGVATDFTGSRSLKLWRTDAGGAWTAPTVVSPALTVPASRPATNNLTLAFAAGVANFNLGSTDIGRYAFNLDDDSLAYAATTISGASTELVVRPFALAISGLTAGSTANPGGSAATDNVFTKAGASFSATIAAYRWSSGADANNDGVPDSGATLAQVAAGGTAPGYGAAVTLTPVAGSQTPAGVLGTLGNNVVGGFANGSATATTLNYSEVGSFQLNTAAVVKNFLGSTLSLDAVVFNGAGAQFPAARVGRFIPAGFALSNAGYTHRVAQSPACSPAASFTYMDEDFGLAFTLTAQNASGATTQNYIGSFAKLGLTAPANFNLAGIAGSTAFRAGGRLSTAATGTGSWLTGARAGTADITFSARALRTATPDGPFDIDFGIAPVDADGVGMMSFDLDTIAPTGADVTKVGTIPVRFGRLRLQNGMAPANRALNLPLEAQYWSGTAYSTNMLDSCSRISASNLSFGNLRRSLAAGDAAMAGTSVTLAAGKASLVLAAPAAGHVGTLDVAIALDTAADLSCLAKPPAWVPAKAATAGANLAALRGLWCGSGSASDFRDPSARATWGLTRGADGVIYQRENY